MITSPNQQPNERLHLVNLMNQQPNEQPHQQPNEQPHHPTEQPQ